jgi:hypothetical protein
MRLWGPFRMDWLTDGPGTLWRKYSCTGQFGSAGGVSVGQQKWTGCLPPLLFKKLFAAAFSKAGHRHLTTWTSIHVLFQVTPKALFAGTSFAWFLWLELQTEVTAPRIQNPMKTGQFSWKPIKSIQSGFKNRSIEFEIFKKLRNFQIKNPKQN